MIHNALKITALIIFHGVESFLPSRRDVRMRYKYFQTLKVVPVSFRAYSKATVPA